MAWLTMTMTTMSREINRPTLIQPSRLLLYIQNYPHEFLLLDSTTSRFHIAATSCLCLCDYDLADADDDVMRNILYLVHLTIPSLTLPIILLAPSPDTAVYPSSNLYPVQSPFLYLYTASALALAGGDDDTTSDPCAGRNRITPPFDSIAMLLTGIFYNHFNDYLLQYSRHSLSQTSSSILPLR